MISNLSNDRFGRICNMCDNFWNENPFTPCKLSCGVVNNTKNRSASADITNQEVTWKRKGQLHGTVLIVRSIYR